MIPSCFSQPNTTASSVHDPHSLISCIYLTHLCNSPTYLTLTWSKSLSSHSLSLHAPPSLSITLSILPSSLSFFRGSSKSISLSLSHKLKLHYDFSRAKYTPNSAQPHSSFYLAISSHGSLLFFLGDLFQELAKRSRWAMPGPLKEDAALARREHVFARRKYVSQGEFMGSRREIGIDVSGGGVLKVTVDGEIRLTVKRLLWKFRGNERFFIAGVAVDFFWDVFNWVGNNGGSGAGGYGVFVFQVGEGAVWPEVVGAEMKMMKKFAPVPASSPAGFPAMSPAGSGSSVMQWAEESSDGGRSSSSSSTRSSGSNGGFSLSLYAWRKD